MEWWASICGKEKRMFCELVRAMVVVWLDLAGLVVS